MTINRILNKIVSREGVYDVFILDRATALRIEIEESKNSGVGCRYENLALAESRSRDVKLCVFSDGFIEAPTDMLTMITDGAGRIHAHDVPQAMPKENIGDGAVWVTESYVIYPNAFSTEEVKFVVLPHSLEFLTEEDGACDVTAFNPSTGTNRYLREALGFDGPRNATSTIISFNVKDE